jgi:[glutamine synthetase] adenylyltransferase / [glutamine synthetase]-adenylyl-L-tyrosine phosphorylase
MGCARTVLPLLALGQMRVIAGPVATVQRIEVTFRGLLTERRSMEALAAGIARARHDAHSAAPAWGPWDLRHRPGGLDDIDTLIRTLQLRHAPDHPEVLGSSPVAALAKFGALGLIGEPLVKALLHAHYLLRQMENMLAVAVEEPFDRDSAPGDLKAALVRACDASDFETLEASLEEGTQRVCAVLAGLLGETGGTALSSPSSAT